jgi:hypothetical protein
MMTFAEFCAGYFKNYFEIHPTEAIYYGIEGYDHLLNDFSDQTYNTEKALVEKSLSELREIPIDDLDRDEAIDYTLLEGRLTIQRYEHEKEDYRLKWPDTYLPVDAIYILTVRPTSDLAGNLLSRLERTPALIQQGIANLSRPEANPPRLWTEMAIEAAKADPFLDTYGHRRFNRRSPRCAAMAVGKKRSRLRRVPRTGSLSEAAVSINQENYNLLLKKHFLHHDAQVCWPRRTYSKTKQGSGACGGDCSWNRYRRGRLANSRKTPFHRRTALRLRTSHGGGARVCEEERARLVSTAGRIARRADAGVSPPRNPFRGLSIPFAERH